MKYLIDLYTDQIKGPSNIASNLEDSPSESIYNLIQSFSKSAWIETGLLPVSHAGLLSYRAAAGFEQIIYQMPPGIYTVRWGETEHDSDAVNYQLAHPWKIIIADFKNGAFTGVRHFFSPDPITYWDQPLYAVNLPNTNTIGYNGTSIGWVCLYLNDDTTGYTLDQKIEYIIHRESGLSEPYNNNNMRNTDGTRFYERNGAPQFMYDPNSWQDRTLAEGYQWICDSNLLISLRVPISGHAERYENESPEYTLRRASFQPYSAYYSDHDYQKPFNILDTYGYDPNHRSIWLSPFIGLNANYDNLFSSSSQEDPLSKDYQFMFSTQVMNKTKLGWLCNSCDNTYSFDEEQYQVVSSYYFDAQNFDLLNKEYSSLCENCASNDTCFVDFFDEYFFHSALVWCDSTSSWTIAEASYSCPSCFTAYPVFTASECTDPLKSNYVYSQFDMTNLALSPIVGCESCIQDHTFVRCHSNGFNLLKEKAVPFKQLRVNASLQETVLEDGTSVKMITPSLSDETYYASPDYMSLFNQTICKCGFLVPKSSISTDQTIDLETPICNSCVVNGEYQSFINTFATTSVSIQNKNVLSKIDTP